MAKFKQGDVVQLKMGASPLMIATRDSFTSSDDSGESVWVLWFDARGHIQTHRFHVNILDGVKDPLKSQNLDGASAPSENQFKRMSDASTPDPCPVCSITNPVKKSKCNNVVCPYILEE